MIIIIFVFFFYLFQDYEVLDQFCYSLEKEEFDNKWALIGWPHKIILQIDITREMLAIETDKFYRLQVSEESLLWEKYEWCVKEVQNLMLVSDVSKVKKIFKKKKNHLFYLN